MVVEAGVAATVPKAVPRDRPPVFAAGTLNKEHYSNIRHATIVLKIPESSSKLAPSLPQICQQPNCHMSHLNLYEGVS